MAIVVASKLETSMERSLIGKYGDIIMGGVSCGDESWLYCTSRWWKDIVALEDNVGIDWFKNEVSRKVGNVETIWFLERCLGG